MSKLSIYISDCYGQPLQQKPLVRLSGIVTTGQILRAIDAAEEIGLDPNQIIGFDEKLSEICRTLEHEMDVTKLVHNNLSVLSRPTFKRIGTTLNRNHSKTILTSYFHDRGKLALNQKILHSTRKLAPSDVTHIQQHTVLGYELLRRKSVVFYNKTLDKINQINNWSYPLLDPKDHNAVLEIAKAAKHHHERLDGTGYPDKLVGQEIPQASLMIAVADDYDAQIKQRCYKKARPKDEVLREIAQRAASHFDPTIVLAHLHYNASGDQLRQLLAPTIEQKRIHVVSRNHEIFQQHPLYAATP
ncbi:MAG: HD domain-containing phosphohydrolase [Alphaproteobacteria bacterium]|jgi:HD-GYP domain-containing protein (c-di-GMP phosphodiesterase class II)|nr:HD domain-containing phosphohydrolase [Alphaproteobacteria bacterium]